MRLSTSSSSAPSNAAATYGLAGGSSWRRANLLRRPPGIIATTPRATTRMCASALVAGVRSPQRRPKVWSALSSATR